MHAVRTERLRTVAVTLALILPLLVSGLPAVGPAVAQEPDDDRDYDRRIHLNTRVLDDPGVDEGLLRDIQASGEPRHAIVQLHRLPHAGEDDLRALQDLGIRLLSYLSGIEGFGTGYLATVEPDVDPAAPTWQELVRGLQPLLPEDKLSLELQSVAADPTAPAAVLVLFFADVDAEEAAATLARHGVQGRERGDERLWEATATEEQVAALAEEDGVEWIDPQTEAQDLLDEVRDESNVDAVHDLDTGAGAYAGRSGAGVHIGIMDSGVDITHTDFAGRIIRVQDDPRDHGTHVAGIAAGSGVQSNGVDDAATPNGGSAFQWRGTAPAAGIAAYPYSAGDLDVFDEAINTFGVDVSNHSYVKDGAQGMYNTNARTIDRIVRGDTAAPARPAVWAAANNASVSGRDCDDDGQNDGQFPQYPSGCPSAFQAGYFSVLTPCKNCLTIGNVQKSRVVAASSSLGPTMDGRLKPEVVAVGTSVRSTGSRFDRQGDPVAGNGYRSKSGTSMAAPAVTGIIALLLEQYATTFGVNLDVAPPLPSTSKAVLAQTATDLTGAAGGTNFDTGQATSYGAGPDFATGFGLVNAAAATAMIADQRFIEDAVSGADHTDEHLVAVPPGQTEVKVTLAWDDRAGSTSANQAAPRLVNDLDIELVSPSGETFLPLVLPTLTPNDCDALSPGVQVGTCIGQDDPSQNYAGPATPGIDRRNNIEQAVVRSPEGLEPGNWTVRVSVLNPDNTVRMPLWFLGDVQSYSLAGVTSHRADLSVTKTADPDPVAAGDHLTYTVSVTNHGPDTATDVAVLDVLPGEVALSASNPPCSVGPADELFCALGDLPSGASTDLEIAVAVPADLVYQAGGPVVITNTADVSSTVPDPSPGNNSASDDTTVVAVADLELIDSAVVGAPTEALIGEDLPLTVRNRMANHGPSGPMDAALTIAASASAGGTVAPALVDRVEPALGIGSVRTANDGFTVRCDEPGQQTFTFTSRIEPAHPDDSDPDPSNNEQEASISVECVVPIVINIRPGNKHNPVQPAANSAVPVAALTTAAGEYGLPVAFDATQIQPDTVRFGHPDLVWADSGGAPHHAGVQVKDAHEPDDQTKDGDDDLVLRFRASLTGIELGDTEACMKGQYEDGGQLFSFFGCDFVQTIP